MDGNCNTCSQLKIKYAAEGSFTTFGVQHTDIGTIKGNNKLEKKKKIIEKFEKYVAALRNSKGGCFILHILGQEAWDRNLEDFDQCFGKCIEEHIEDGQLFTNTCERYWISSLDGFDQFTDCLLIEVTKTEGVVTVDFNTKLRSDFENRKPLCINIISLLQVQSEPSRPNPIIGKFKPKEGERIPIVESRHVELKSIKPEVEEYNVVKSNLEGLIRYIWSNLKLKDNISSLTKVKGGGSYIVGLAQVAITVSREYKTKQTKVVGFELHVNKDDFVKALKRKFSTDLCVLSENNFEDFDEQKVDIKFHIVHENPQKYILEVAVGHVCGIVFYDKQGPRTYGLDENGPMRMEKEEWLRRLKTIQIPQQVEEKIDSSLI